MMRWQRTSSMVMGFSVITSQPNSIARQIYPSCVLSREVTITQSGFDSPIIRSKSSAR
jgi:hypothetical protein